MPNNIRYVAVNRRVPSGRRFNWDPALPNRDARDCSSSYIDQTPNTDRSSHGFGFEPPRFCQPPRSELDFNIPLIGGAPCNSSPRLR